MKYTPIDPQLFIQNRANLAKELKPNSVVALTSADIMPKSADGTMPFIQNTDIFYLCGIDQEETLLVLNPDSKDENHREVLFIKKTSEEIAIWEGHKLTRAEAQKISGIQTIYWLDTFDKVFSSLIYKNDNIYLNTNEHLRANVELETKELRFLKSCKKNYPLHNFERLNPIMHKLRAIKSPIEIEQIQQACNITEKAFRRVLDFVKPGVWEFEIEAEITHEFLKNRSRRNAYEPIIASGSDSCVLHYISNEKQCKDGDILLFDFGCEYANYAADLSRTIPVNGRFSDRQKAVYNAVLRVQRKAIEMLVPGNNLKDYTQEVCDIMEKELIGLKLIDKHDVAKQDPKNPLYRKYFMHGVSHHLGLDVHDYGNMDCKFEEGMVFTCEPGIYIREESLGIRIENDILITNDQPIDLMKNIPIEVNEIEDLMNS